ncbi:DUF4297 domain-containing protein [Mycoplasma sp. T363T]|uniref:dsDNA nuclease domain-containing protein n=1 Tax=Mycoplasma bradburyae TaxID=2963128 RepID=UPI0023408AA2|nr:dsDNA nuclease domain-containing protein [Mycoplasma bradburyae]MDC4163156.1 DUF4297 domain-containing protein [Mycoplasma bradburyae]
MDVVSGSRTYNRLKFQISQSILFIIDIYDNFDDFLLTLDYFDDISIFDNEEMNGSVSYYQLKTNENVTIAHIIKEKWIDKLHEHLSSQKNVNVSKISLVLSSDLKYKKKKIVEYGEKKFSDFPDEVKSKIIDCFREKNNCNQSEIDLSKFSVIKTVLTKYTHKDLAKQKLTDFLEKINPEISIRIVDLTFDSLFRRMGDKQSFELPKDASNDLIRDKKSISKKEFSKIIDYANLITMHDFKKIAEATKDIASEEEIGLAYAKMLSDIKKRDEDFFSLFNKSVEILDKFDMKKGLSFADNLKEYVLAIKNENPTNFHVKLNDFYCEVIGASLLLKKP